MISTLSSTLAWLMSFIFCAFKFYRLFFHIEIFSLFVNRYSINKKIINGANGKDQKIVVVRGMEKHKLFKRTTFQVRFHCHFT